MADFVLWGFFRMGLCQREEKVLNLEEFGEDLMGFNIILYFR